ncbi:Cortactin-binding protein 2 [Actinoplanes sp. SE50]|nr:Cortactin-binding protein 2 [Actinoplanes sp. SE50/110]ATO85914.1 Cortactin-binding protein 2 [Actinoplanes sp. SE50]SLM03328.1 hypothetical protein ACSP50_6617 [Actinoplanes sp. SE50/110]
MATKRLATGLPSRSAAKPPADPPEPEGVPRIRKAVAVALPLLAGSLLLAACASATTPQAAPSPTGTPWLLMATGSVAPSPTRSVSPGTTPGLASLPPLPSGSATPRPSGSPGCDPAVFKGGQINGLDVTAGSTTATVKWFNPGGDQLVDYHILAVSQKLVVGAQPETPGWLTVTPTACGWMTATVTGLIPKTPYVFSVDGMWLRAGTDGTYTRTVARSGVITTA